MVLRINGKVYRQHRTCIMSLRCSAFKLTVYAVTVPNQCLCSKGEGQDRGVMLCYACEKKGS